MKKMFLAFILALAVLPIFAQTNTILDYFPFTNNNVWLYKIRASYGDTNENEFTLVSHGVMGYTFSEDNLPLVYINRIMKGEEKYWTASLYKVDIADGFVYCVSARSSDGTYYEEEKPYKVECAYFNKKWKREESYNGKVYSTSEYRTYKDSIKFDDLQFSDCIVLEETRYKDGKIDGIGKNYFAKNIGLVYTTWKSGGDGEEFWVMKLVDSTTKN